MWNFRRLIWISFKIFAKSSPIPNLVWNWINILQIFRSCMFEAEWIGEPSPDLIKKRWKSPDGCLCYCSEGKPWYLRELFLRHSGPRVMGNTLIFWPENLDRLCVYAGAGEIFPTKGGRRGTGWSWPGGKETGGSCLQLLSCREELDMERYHRQSLIKRNPASNYHYTVIGTSS